MKLEDALAWADKQIEGQTFSEGATGPHVAIAVLADAARQYQQLQEDVRDYLRHPSEDGSPLRREKRRKLAAMVGQ